MTKGENEYRRQKEQCVEVFRDKKEQAHLQN